MQLPDKKTPIEKLLRLAQFTAGMMKRFGKDAAMMALSGRMDRGYIELTQAQDGLRDSIRAAVDARVGVQFSDHVADGCVRKVAKRAETSGDQGKLLMQRLLPDNASAVTRRVGQAQVELMKDLEDRLAGAVDTWSEASALHNEVVEHRKGYEAALAARKAAVDAVRSMRIQRDVVREKFLDMYAKTCADIESKFPRDRRMQDLFFDTVRERKGRNPEEDEGGEE